MLFLAGKTFNWARTADLEGSIECVKYYAGWADKITGQHIEVCTRSAILSVHCDLTFYSQTDEGRLAYTRHEPFGVVVRLPFGISQLKS